MVIEFFGHSGSGKETTARLVAERLALDYRMIQGQVDNDHRPIDPRIVRRQRAIAAVRHPRLMFVGVRLVAVTHRPAMLGLAFMAARRSMVMAAETDAVIDEGPRHGLCANLGYRADLDVKEWATRFARLIPTPDVAVWLTCDPEISWQRIRNRTRSVAHRYGALEGEGIAEYVDRYDAAAAALAGDRAVRIDTSRLLPPEVAEAVTARLRVSS